jgi:amino acid transporter
MAVIVLGWGIATLLIEGPRSELPFAPHLQPKENYSTGQVESPLGFLEGTALGNQLARLEGRQYFSLLGALGILIAFGHSILAMSGEETLAQVYREVEAPKLTNFKKAAFIVFLYSMILTAGVSFLAVLLIPDNIRMRKYADNLIGGLAMHVYGPIWARLLLNGFVVVVGFLILSGAVNTAIIGSNGVLNRVAEDGVVPGWLQKPHPRYGTTYRILTLILALQLVTILASRGDVIVLGEAYAFGVVWSFVFMTLSMLVLRFKAPAPRAFKVPLNLRLGSWEVPIGLGMVFLVLIAAAIANLLTKTTATKWGLAFTAAFMAVFIVTDRISARRRRGEKHEHLEQFNQQTAEKLSASTLGLTKPYRKLVAIRSPSSMYMLEKSLAETDPETTDVIVMTAKVTPADESTPGALAELTDYDQQLMTAVVQRAEIAGKHVKPLIVPTNNPLHAILRAASDLDVQELVLGSSNKYTAEEQLDQVAFYWVSMHGGEPKPLTVRILGRNRDLYLDLGGGNRIPKISERQARSVAELRAAGVGVDRVLLVQDGTPAARDLFESVLTMLDPQVALTLVAHGSPPTSEGATRESATVRELIEQELELARQLRREVDVAWIEGDFGEGLVDLIQKGQYDLAILPMPEQRPTGSEVPWEEWTDFVLTHTTTTCRVLLAPPQLIPNLAEE